MLSAPEEFATGLRDRHLSSHDLRLYGVHRLLVEERVNPRVVMAIGGWAHFESLTPHLNQPSEN